MEICSSEPIIDVSLPYEQLVSLPTEIQVCVAISLLELTYRRLGRVVMSYMNISVSSGMVIITDNY